MCLTVSAETFDLSNAAYLVVWARRPVLWCMEGPVLIDLAPRALLGHRLLLELLLRPLMHQLVLYLEVRVLLPHAEGH